MDDCLNDMVDTLYEIRNDIIGFGDKVQIKAQDIVL